MARLPSGLCGQTSFGLIAIKFDAVIVRIAKIERFAHAVIGGAVKVDSSGDYAAKRVGQGCPVGIKDRRVIQTGGSRGGRRPPKLSQVFSPM